MANIKFNYLYRDAGNYKKRASVVFSNPEGLTLHSVAMRVLISYISKDRRNKGRAYTKCPITPLPFELLTSLACPSRRVRFNSHNRLCQSHRWRNLNQQMDVVIHTADSVSKDPEVLANPRCIGP